LFASEDEEFVIQLNIALVCYGIMIDNVRTVEKTHPSLSTTSRPESRTVSDDFTSRAIIFDEDLHSITQAKDEVED